MTVKERIDDASQHPWEAELAALYAEFADEDRSLAEEGMGEYADQLAAEDSL